MTEDEMVGWHHRVNEHESEQTPGGGGRQRSLACCSPWGSKTVKHDLQLNNNYKRSNLPAFSLKEKERNKAASDLSLKVKFSPFIVFHKPQHLQMSSLISHPTRKRNSISFSQTR